MAKLMETPTEELAKRAAETLPGLQAAAAAVGLEDHRRMLFQHAHRVKRDYLLGLKAIGAELPPEGENDVEPMGDIIITGDIVTPNPKVPWQRGEPAPQGGGGNAVPNASASPTQTPPQIANLSPWLKAALVAAGVAVGAPVAGLGTWAALRPTPPAVAGPDRPDKDFQLKLLPADKPGAQP